MLCYYPRYVECRRWRHSFGQSKCCLCYPGSRDVVAGTGWIHSALGRSGLLFCQENAANALKYSPEKVKLRELLRCRADGNFPTAASRRTILRRSCARLFTRSPRCPIRRLSSKKRRIQVIASDKSPAPGNPAVYALPWEEIAEFCPMTVIELPDEQAAALKAKAAAQGLTLETWLQKLAGEEEVTSSAPRSPQEAASRILQLQKRVKPDPEGWTVHDYINHGRP
jgi:hypothetical protein